MYVRQLTIENIRSIERFELKFEEGKQAGWHVILGDNGAGKSTVVQSLALALIGPPKAVALRQDWGKWLRFGVSAARLELRINSIDGQKCLTEDISLEEEGVSLSIDFSVEENSEENAVDICGGDGYCFLDELWKKGGRWFSASFGPFRRFSGKEVEFRGVRKDNIRLSAHFSVFWENIALSDGLNWLSDLRVYDLERKRVEKVLFTKKKISFHESQVFSRDYTPGFLEKLITFLNESHILPNGIRIFDVGVDDVFVTDGGELVMSVTQLSDGYRSILSMIFEIMRLLSYAYGERAVAEAIDIGGCAVHLPGIVAIDEVDAHLHPSWQKEIGPWFTRCFPEIQFIVTTHSPIICRNATTVWHLAAPGSDEPSGQIDGTTLDRLLYGSILEAYGTSLFGQGVERSDASRDMLQELAGLNRKLLRHGLDEDERKRLDELRRVLPTRASEAMTTHGSANASDC